MQRGGGPLRFGRYESLFRIAAGGMAEVFAARIRAEAGFEKLVAVKRMLPHLAEDEEFVEMFLDEARIAVCVSSPHVVQTLDLGRADDGALYIVMELIVGVPLWALIVGPDRKLRPLPPAIGVEILAQACDGLDDAHDAIDPASGDALGIVHRDVSPQNVLVGIDGRARVSDFGISRAMNKLTATEAGRLRGKAAYFSPEQSHGKALDRRSDVFALGIIAWEALTGARLFSGADELETIERVRSLEVPPLRRLRPDLPAGVEQAVARALARDPAARWPTARDFGDALRTGLASDEATRITARDVGRFVQEAGFTHLAQLQQRLRMALERPDVVTLADVDAPSSEEWTQLVAGPEAETHLLGQVPRTRALGERPTHELGTATVLDVTPPSPVTVPAGVVARPARSRTIWIVAGIVSAAIVAATWVVISGDDEVSVTELAPRTAPVATGLRVDRGPPAPAEPPPAVPIVVATETPPSPEPVVAVRPSRPTPGKRPPRQPERNSPPVARPDPPAPAPEPPPPARNTKVLWTEF